MFNKKEKQRIAELEQDLSAANANRAMIKKALREANAEVVALKKENDVYAKQEDECKAALVTLKSTIEDANNVANETITALVKENEELHEKLSTSLRVEWDAPHPGQFLYDKSKEFIAEAKAVSRPRNREELSRDGSAALGKLVQDFIKEVEERE